MSRIRPTSSAVYRRWPLGVFWGRTSPRYSQRSEEHTSELQSRLHLVCRLLLEKKNNRHAPWLLRTRGMLLVPSHTGHRDIRGDIRNTVPHSGDRGLIVDDERISILPPFYRPSF